ncbi:HPr family phosphocarrier protein [Changpingibacter yushuensis]|uniref:HPr family phosphocarrier protein n=1 Tax=Changpingibacter yushuensis TaxID=2758440 RepID=UPI0015F4A2C0|nr:HPr family phosphocarrier protein [Changpingibacter yushuensis]
MSTNVGFVLVSHSPLVATAVADLAAEMAPDVQIEAVGGAPVGGFGTDVNAVFAACERVESTCERVVLMADLGSARMAAEMAIELTELAEDGTPRRVIGPGPFLEGSVAGAAKAQTGAKLAAVVRTVASALEMWREHIKPENTVVLSPATGQSEGFQTQVTVVDDEGLHARPAALLAQLASEQPCTILINGVAADSMMDILLLGVKKGESVIISSPDPHGEEPVRIVAAALAAGLSM